MSDAAQLSDVVRLSALPSAGKRVRSFDALEESTWPHSPANLEIAEVIGKVKQAVPKLNLGNVLTDVHGFSLEFLGSHVHALHRCSNTEQTGNDARMDRIRKTVTEFNHEYMRGAN